MRQWLKDIVDKDGRPIQEIARDLGVVRESIYQWLNGGEILPKNRRQLAANYGDEVLQHLFREDSEKTAILRDTPADDRNGEAA